jgi:NAD(P)-dependent dehydrogenase (short-subunit alcohol dehydrogenase family)
VSKANAGKTVLTTGANSGIGLACAIEVARHGFRSVGSVRSDAKARIVHEAAAEAGVGVDTVVLDVTDARRCAEVLAGLELYGLVNNAGYGITGAVEDVDDEEARAVLETMVIAPMRLARLALPAMRARGGGRIVNVSSIYGRATTPLTGWYQAAKHAIEALSDALRMEVASGGVKVVLVEPGGFRTGIWEDLQRDVDKRGTTRYEGAYRRVMSVTRLSQPVMGHPAAAARVVAGALRSRSPRARYLVGYDAHAIALWSRVTPTLVKDTVTRVTLGL